MSRRPALLLAALLLAALPAAATPMASAVPSGDDAIGQPVATRRMVLAFVDADLDSVFDASGPAEPMYLDADASATVTYGDLRLMPFGPYGNGTDVAPADTDVGRGLSPLRGWFAVAGTSWFVDIDSSNTVSVGDVRLDADDGPAGQRVAAGDEVGARLTAPTSAEQAAFRDLDGDGRRDAGEAIVVDLDASGTVTAGDLRLHVADAPSATTGGDGSTAGEDGAGRGDDGPDAGGAASSDGRSLRGFDVLLLTLVVANLLGLVYVVRAMSSSRPPRNPFK